MTCPASTRYQLMDACRGIACLLVVIYHATMVNSAQSSQADTTGHDLFSWAVLVTRNFDFGVPMFFVISGYCIAASAERHRQMGLGAAAFFRSRMRRIFPPLWVAIAATAVFFLIVDSWLFPGVLSSPPWEQPRPWWYSGWQWLGNLTLTESWRYHVIGNGRGHFPGQAWTLCYEEQFYAIVGLTLFVAAPTARSFIATLTAIVFVVCILSEEFSELARGFFFDGSWLQFSSGLALFYALNMQSTRSIVLFIGMMVMLCTMAYLRESHSHAMVAAFCCVLFSLHRFDAKLTGNRFVRPLMTIGMMCYSIYLVHQVPVKAISYKMHQLGFHSNDSTILITLPICVFTSLGLGFVFHRIVEVRYMTNHRKTRGDPDKLQTSSGTAGLVLSSESS